MSEKDKARVEFLWYNWVDIFDSLEEDKAKYNMFSTNVYREYYQFSHATNNYYKTIYELYKSLNFNIEQINDLIDSEDIANLIICIELLKQLNGTK
jgi:hypothetical protein